MRLWVPPGVFTPRSDSWRLAAVTEANVRPGDDVLDLCTGSGLVAVAAGRAGAARVYAVDSSRLAVWTARINGLLNGVRIQGRRGNLFAPVAGRRFDLITANPPYLPGPDVPDRGPLSRAIEGGPSGRRVIDQIINGAPDHLSSGGKLLLVHSSVSDIDASLALIRHTGLQAEVHSRHRGSLGPLLTARRASLVTAGLLDSDSTEEEIAVLIGTKLA
jgi:release factor glutamine methyltransferase